MTATVTKRGKSSVTDTDLGYARAVEKLREISTHWVNAGLFGDSYNDFGERIATYAHVHDSPKGARPGWIKQVWERAKSECVAASPALRDAAVRGAPSMDVATNALGERIAARMGELVREIGLVETGELARWMANYESPTTEHRKSGTGTRFRIARAGGFGDLSEAQQLYQLYHGGRQRSMRLMRRSTTFAEFKAAHATNWGRHTNAERVIAKRAVAQAARHAERVMRANYAPKMRTTGGAYNASRSAFLSALLGLSDRQRSELDVLRTSRLARTAAKRTKVEARQRERAEAKEIAASMAASRARSRATERARDQVFASIIRRSLSGGRRGRR